MTVGIRDLKARLSEHIERARLGENIVVTDRGKPVAMLVPLPTASALDRGIEEGWIEPNRRTGLSEFTARPSARSSRDVLDADRG